MFLQKQILLKVATIIIFRSSQYRNEVTNEKDVQNLKHQAVYLLLIGPAGAGKTTISKRVVLNTIQQKNIVFLCP